MRVSFFGYSLERRADGMHVLMDMRPFLRAFIEGASARLKLEFEHAGEHMFLTGGIDGAFSFLITRDGDVIKSIDTGNLHIRDIEDILQRDESVAFASYLRMESHHLGFASTVQGPRHRAFAVFVNQLLARAGINDWRFVMHPFMEATPRDQAMRARFIGKSIIQIGRGNALFQRIKEVFNGVDAEWDGIDSIEVVIKPAERGRRNIAGAVRPIIEAIPDDDLRAFTVRAKEDMHDRAVDLYLAGQGHLFEEISRGDDAAIHAGIREAMRQNEALHAKLRQYEGNEGFERHDIESIGRFCDAGAWAGIAGDL